MAFWLAMFVSYGIVTESLTWISGGEWVCSGASLGGFRRGLFCGLDFFAFCMYNSIYYFLLLTIHVISISRHGICHLLQPIAHGS